MGCWNETCMLTHLPILPGDRVAGLVIAQRRGHYDASYPDGRFAPATLPFFGRYDDYGGVEDLENETETLDELFRSGIYTAESDVTGMTRSINVPLQINDRIIPDMCEASRDHRLLIMHYDSYHEATVVLMRREFYDFAVESMKSFVSESAVTEPGFNSRTVGRLNKWQHKGQVTPGDILPVARLTAFMNICRLSYGPTCGAGSQTGIEYDFQEAFLKKIVETAMELK